MSYVEEVLRRLRLQRLNEGDATLFSPGGPKCENGVRRSARSPTRAKSLAPAYGS